MANNNMSSDSEYSNLHIQGHERVTDKVEHLAATLQDTNKNLRAMDKMLDDYRELGGKQEHKMDRLRNDLSKTTERLREEKMKSRELARSPRGLRHSDLDRQDDYGKDRPRRSTRRTPTSPLGDYEQTASDNELYQRGEHGLRPVRSGAVKFYDDMDTRQVHQGLRDLNSHQVRIGDDLDREIDRRNRWELQSKRTFQEVHEALRKPDLTRSSVDKRLQSIQDELRSERQQLRKENHEVGKISVELKKALDQQKDTPGASPDDSTQLKAWVSQSDAQSTLIEELKKQLSHSDQEKSRLRSLMDQQNDDLKTLLRKIAYKEREQEQERQRQETEVRELRSQLSKSASIVGECSDVRRELDQSERQRTQLSDHIDVLSKDLEQREKQTAKISTQLQTTSEKYAHAEQQRQHLSSQMEDTVGKLRQTSQISDSYAIKLRDIQKHLQESESRKAEIKARAQETVRKWKVKCKNLERDVDRHKHSAEQATARCEQLIKELELSRNHSNTAIQQVDHMKREFSELLAIRAQQDEQVRLKDIEVNELKSLKLDIDKELRDCKMVIERMEYELHGAKEKCDSSLEDKHKLEDHLVALDKSQHIAQAQLHQLQRELQEVSVVKVELSSQLADVVNERQQVKQTLSESMKNEAKARAEIQCLVHRLNAEKELYSKRVDAMTSKLDSIKEHESHRMQKFSRHYKKEKAEYEAELHAMKIDLQEERSTMKLLNKQHDKLKIEVDRLNKELAIKEDEISQFQQQYHLAREDFLTKNLLTEGGLSRTKEVELELLNTKEELRSNNRDFENVCHNLAAEVDGVVEVAAMDSLQTYKALSFNKSLTSHPRQCVVEIKSRLDWLKNEFRERLDKEQWINNNMMDVTNEDRQYFTTEMERENDALDHLSELRVIEITDKGERDFNEINHQQPHSMDSDDDKETETPVLQDHLLNNSLVKETQKEREQIHERFARLQDTMNCLKQELVDTHDFNQLVMTPSSSTDKTSTLQE